MKRIPFLFAFLFASIVAFAQSGNIVAGQIDTASSSSGIVAKPNLSAAYNNLKTWINLPIKVNSPYYYYSFGDSFTSGTGASALGNRYANLNAAYLKVPFTNRGISGSGAFSAIGQAYQFDAYGALASCMIGLNDVKAGATTTSALTLAKIQNGVFAIIANHFVDSTFAAGSGTRISTTGTWSAYSAAAQNGLYSNGLSTVTSGSSITFYSYGTKFLLALVGSDGTRYTYGSASITIDGTSYGTINENGQTDGIYDGLGNDNGRMPFSVLYSGLSEGKHTIVLTSIGTNPFCIDFFGELKNPAQCFPIVIYDIAYVNATGQVTYPSSTNANTNAANAVIASDISTFTALGYPVYHALTNTYYNATTDAYTDNLHPSDIGHRHLYQAFYSAISSLQNPFVLQDLRSTATPSFVNVSLSGLTQAGIVYNASGPVLATSAADFNYGSNTAGYLGLGVSGVNADSKLRVLDATSGAGLRIAYNSTAVNYYDANTHNIRTTAGGTILQLTSSAATFYESLLPINTNTYNLGSSSQAFAKGYINNLIATNATFSAGTTTVAPIVFASGTNLTSATAGAVEYNGTNLFYTDATPTRHTIMNLDQNQTVTGKLTLNGSISASANLAQTLFVNPTQTAVANNDALFGVDINPTIAGVGIISTLGTVTGGSSYTNGTYTAVPLTGGNGSGAQATVVVSGGVVSTVTITTAGTRYLVGDVLSAAAANIGGTGSGFSVPVATLTQTVTGAPIRSTVSNIGGGSGSSYTGSWSDGIFLYNPTAATATLQQNSPGLHFSSFGWGTTGGTSQAVDAFIYNQVNSGTVPNANLTIAFGVAGAKTGGSYTFGSGGAAIFTSGSLTITRAGQGATAFNSLIQQNTTAATSSTPNQWTPTWYQQGAVWNTGGTPASNSYAFGLNGQSTSSANPYGTWVFQSYIGTSTTPTLVSNASLTTQGQFNLGLQATTNIQPGSTAGTIFNIGAETLTDASTASGTVTNFAVIGTGLTTLAATNASITYTNGYGALFTQPTNGTNVTMTNKYALGLAYDATHLFTVSLNSAGAATLNATSTITITPATTITGALTNSATTTTLKHLAGSTSAPSIVAGTGAGTSPTVSVSGTDISGIVNITTGTSPSGSNAIVATVTFNTAYASAPKGVVLVPANVNAAALTNATQVFVPANGQTNGTTTTTFVVESNGTALAASTAYIWTYTIIQ